ncbi:hypothetical protein SLS62_000063 [Diatrype stigma]|uniref:Calcineurin-like phosphoesterase domain-containing protein n=1 Tax=Diatrype stigma TaxID=117547 RepID=A0AAN9YUP9_9PEZI
MITKRTSFLAVSLATLANAAQPEAPEPVAAPMRDLEWGQINFLHTTDTHGWHGGHLQEAQYSGDWGDYISFADHMRKKADEKGVDLLVIDSGDRIEGNGLYDASEPKGLYTSDILKEQHIDLLCTGNHELYQAASVAREHEVTVPNFRSQYLASNLDYVEPETGNAIPQARRYRKFVTRNGGYTVVAFGFLFDFERGANNSAVTPVADAIAQDWFQQAIREKPDLFVVNGHVGLRMREFELVFKAIRAENWYTPIAFFGGHVHVRDARRFDDKAFALASGRYMETIGWMSIDGIQKQSPDGGEGSDGGEQQQQAATGSSSSVVASTIKPGGTPSFKRRYIDNNLFNLRHHTGLNASAFATEHGRNVTAAIAAARRALGLDHTYGCAPRDLWMTRAAYPGKASVYSWLEAEVLPDVVASEARRGVPRLAILNTGAVRFDIFAGPFTRDSAFLVSPFESGFSYVPDVAYDVASKVLQILNKGGPVWAKAGAEEHQQQQFEMPDLRYLNIPEMMMAPYSSFKTSSASSSSSLPGSSVPGVAAVAAGDSQKPLGGGASAGSSSGGDEEPPLVGGYTTKDDLGDDGDDAVHSPIEFFSVPNCIQAEIGFPAEGEAPERVDLVFNDYVRPWIVPALKFSGGDYEDGDIRPYIEGKSFTDLLVGWVEENWADEC